MGEQLRDFLYKVSLALLVIVGALIFGLRIACAIVRS